MWFDQIKIDALEHALKTGQKGDIRSILADLTTAGKNPNEYTFCPKCGKPFVRKTLLYLRMVVPACPLEHGVWLSEAKALKIKQFFEKDNVSELPGGNKQVTGFILGAMIMISFTVLHFLERKDAKPLQDDNTTYSMGHLTKVSPQNWPNRDFSMWNTFPEKQNAITDPDELAYFQQWIILLNEGIVNRLNMNDALLAKRPPQEYADVYYYFQQRQNDIIRRLRDLYPPYNLQAFHNLVIEASEYQVEFYDDYTRQKTNNPSLNFNDLLTHSKLKSCDQKLWAAYYEFQRVYPNRDAATNNAIEQRLCWMDLI